jgi:hypothetical protein
MPDPEDVRARLGAVSQLCFGLCVSFLVAGTLVLQRKGQRPRASCYSPGAGNHLRDLNLEELLAGAQVPRFPITLASRPLSTHVKRCRVSIEATYGEHALSSHPTQRVPSVSEP